MSFMSIFVQAQKEVQPSATTPRLGAYPDKDVVVYKNALSLGDLETATYALHNIIAANPNGSIYKDTLALVYLERSYYVQAQLLTKTLNQERENDTRTEILAICAKKLGQTTDAIDLYKKLFSISKNKNYLFEQVQLEYQIKRLEEAKLSAEKLLDLIKPDDKISLNVTKLDNKTIQQITLKAGVHYLLGNIFLDLKDTTNAKLQLEKAVNLNQDYELAIELLQKLIGKDELDKKKNNLNFKK